MKKQISLCVAAALCLAASAGQPMKFLSFNIWGDYFKNPVGEREAAIESTIRQRRGTRGRHRVHDPAVRAGRHLAPGGDAQLVERLPVQEPLRRLRHRARRRGGVDATRRREGADEAALDQPRAAALQEGPPRAARLGPRLLPRQHGRGEERHVGRAGGQDRQAALHLVRDAFLVQGQRRGERRDPRVQRPADHVASLGAPPQVGRPARDRRRRPQRQARRAGARRVRAQRVRERGGRGGRPLAALFAPWRPQARRGSTRRASTA